MALTARRLGFDSTTLRVLWTIGAMALLYAIRHVVLLLVVSILAAYALLPLVNFLDRFLERGKRRPLALAAVYLLMVAIIVTTGSIIGVYAGRQATALGVKVREVLTSGETVVLPIPEFLKPLLAQVMPEVTTFLRDHAQEIIQTLSQWTIRLLAGLRNFGELAVVFILSFFILKDGARIVASFLDSLPYQSGMTARAMLDEVHVALSIYVRTMVLIALLTGVVYAMGLSLMGVPYALLLGVIAFPFEFIPMLGPLVSTLAILFVALFSGYHGLGWILLFLVVWRLIQDYGLLPLLMGSELDLSPLVMVAGILAGQAVAGIAGALLAVPVLAVARIALAHLALADANDTPSPRPE